MYNRGQGSGSGRCQAPPMSKAGVHWGQRLGCHWDPEFGVAQVSVSDEDGVWSLSGIGTPTAEISVGLVLTQM